MQFRQASKAKLNVFWHLFKRFQFFMPNFSGICDDFSKFCSAFWHAPLWKIIKYSKNLANMKKSLVQGNLNPKPGFRLPDPPVTILSFINNINQNLLFFTDVEGFSFLAFNSARDKSKVWDKMCKQRIYNKSCWSRRWWGELGSKSAFWL